MSFLWHNVQLYPDYEWPRDLSAYPNTASKRFLSFVRKVTLSLYRQPDDNYPTKDDFYELFHYISGCFRLLKGTRAIDKMKLCVGLYDPSEFPSGCTNIIETINRSALQILNVSAR